jgi:putative oxidoreductase
MSMRPASAAPPRPWPLFGAIAALIGLARRIPPALPQLVLRIAVALPFLSSGLTKWEGFLQLSPAAAWLFANEFRLHLLGEQYPYPFPTLAAWLAGCAEIVLPALLLLGLGTRLAACGLLVMTGVIQLTVPEGWQNFHLPWAAMLLAILVHGPGAASLDHLIARRIERAP